MAKRKKTAQVRKTAINNLIEVSVVEDLFDQMTEWKENMESANMEQLPKFEEVSECVENLESAKDKLQSGIDDLEAIDDPVVKELLKREVEYKYFPPAGRHVSRQTQLEDARDDIERGFNVLSEALENDEPKLADDVKEELKSAIDQIEEALGELDAVSFPGMY